MTTVITLVLLAVLLVFAVLRMYRKNRKGGGCCGEHEEDVRKCAVSDRNPKHYPYRYTLLIGGMTCDNCARRVENALNELPGTWASVSISDKKADLRLKEKIDEPQIRRAVTSAGYAVLDILGR